MDKLDRKMELLSKIFDEKKRRTEVEQEAERLFLADKFEESNKLLLELDDSIIINLRKELAELMGDDNDEEDIRETKTEKDEEDETEKDGLTGETIVMELDQEAIDCMAQHLRIFDCMAQHLKIFFFQTVHEKIADFGEPCVTCPYARNCNLDWLSILGPLFLRTAIHLEIELKNKKEEL